MAFALQLAGVALVLLAAFAAGLVVGAAVSGLVAFAIGVWMDRR